MTPLCDELGIRWPVIQAAIGGITCPALAAAVSNAGGLGSLALTGAGYEGAAARLAETRRLTDRLFLANLLLAFPAEDELRAILEAPPEIICFFLGDVAPYAARVHDAGAKLMAEIGSVAEAVAAAEAGADLIVARGIDTGGHVRGVTGTMSLVPQVVDAVAPVPVIAAGGISDGRGLAAALALGAGAAWIGTRFLAAAEADINEHYAARVVGAGPDETHLSTLWDGGWPDAQGRVLRNSTIEAWEAAGYPPPGERPGEGEVIIASDEDGEILRYQPTALRKAMRGDIEAGSLWAGQGVGLVNERLPARQIVETLAAEAQAAWRVFH